MSGQVEDVAQRLHRWANQEMHFMAQGKYVNAPPPTADDFKDICRGNMVSVWQYVLQHVHSIQTVHKIEGNLSLKSQLSKSSAYKARYKGDTKFSSEREAQIKKRRDLRAKVAGAKADIQHLDKYLENLKKEILSAEQQYQQSCKEMSNIHHKRALLSCYSHDCKADAARYEEYQKRLGGRLENYQSVRSPDGGTDQQYFSRQGTSRGERTDSPTLETSCTKSVRDVCGDIKCFLEQLLQGKFNKDQKAIQGAKDRIWTEIEKTMAENSPQDVLASLATITMETSNNLKQVTAAVNIEKDAEELRFKHESGLVHQETESGGSQLQSVHQLIEEKQLSHITTFMEAEKSRNRASKLDQQLTEQSAVIDGKLAAMFSNNPRALELARKLFALELELAGAAAALQCLHSLKDKLAEVAATDGKAKEALYAKYQKIQDFKGLSEQKQNLIQVLVRQNMDARKKLEDKQRELGRYMESKLCSHKAGVVAMTTKLKGRVSRETETFASLPLHLLQTTHLDSGETLPVCQLSINRLTDQSPSAGGGALQEALTLLNFPMYKAPECLLPYLVELKVEMTDIQGMLRSHDALGYHGNSDGSGGDIIKHIQGLCEEVSVSDEEQKLRLLPVLQRALSEASSAMGRCLKAREHVTAWWEQPSQYLTPWVKVDDLTMQQWMDRWSMLATQLRQVDK